MRQTSGASVRMTKTKTEFQDSRFLGLLLPKWASMARTVVICIVYSRTRKPLIEEFFPFKLCIFFCFLIIWFLPVCKKSRRGRGTGGGGPVMPGEGEGLLWF